jgi:hypothetical protein
VNPAKARRNGREAERTALLFPMKIVRHMATGKKYDSGFCIDLSLTGAAFLSEAELNLADIVELVSGPDSRPVFRRYAWLQYRSGRRYGVRFIRPD